MSITTSSRTNQVFENDRQYKTKKLFILPGYCDILGGTTVSLLMLAKGFALCGLSEQLCVIVQKDSFL